MRRLWAILSCTVAFFLLFPALAEATIVTKHRAAYIWAEHQEGKPYIWGGLGPVGFDCSGLVVKAYSKEGIHLPRTTYDMLTSPLLKRIAPGKVRKGDLAFYGSGHVELVAGGGRTYGALHTGAPIWWHNPSQFWHPTEYFRVRGSSKHVNRKLFHK